ncbi:hypothetical protein Fmac_008895 [Flemingia macrophylla]|uniref:Uncharacterized protein n=1 Tax=Flemingia macrophylla TaxID=520843 RepID=A0ABD1N149_9FABA
MEYYNYNRVSEIEREPVVEYSTPRPVLSGYGQHPNTHHSLNEKIVSYAEDMIVGGSTHHSHNHHHPSDTVERVKVVEYENVPERRVVYEEKVDYDTYSPRRTRPAGYF